MQFTRYASKNPYIDYLFIVRQQQDSLSQKEVQFFPDGKSVIVFNLGSDFSEHGNSLPRCLLSAICTESHLLQVKDKKTDLIGVQFKPYGLYPFVNPSIKEIATQIHSLELLFGSEISALEEMLFENQSDSVRINTVENFFLRKMKRSVPEQIQALVADITREKGCTTVYQLGKKFDVSERTVERAFANYLGISPKKYIRLARFQAIVEALKDRQEEKLTSIAYDFGYADQSHFIKDFQEFTNLKPSSFRKKMPVSDFYNFEV